MTKILDRIKRFLLSLRRRGHRWRVDSITFPRFEVATLCSELGVKEKAAEYGAHDLPPADAARGDGTEQEIIARLQGDIREIRGHANVTYSGLCKRISELDVRTHVEPLGTLNRQFDQQLAILETERAGEVKAARRFHQSLRSEYEEFRSKRHIQREPNYPDSKTYLWGLLLFSVVAEGLLNALFFERGSTRGFVGGAGFALLLAFADVLIIFWIGRLAAWMASKRLWEILIGVSASIAAFVWVVGYNLLVSHAREQLQRTVEIQDAAQQALADFLSNPLSLTQADSWVLFVIGTAFSTMALFSGIRWDDAIRGYGALHRRLGDAAEELDYHIRALFREGRSLREDFLSMHDAGLRDARSDLVALENAIRTKRALLTNLEGFRKHCEDTLQALIQIYRSENRKARSEPAPEYFNKPVRIELVEPFPVEAREDEQRLAEQSEVFGSAQSRSSRVKDDIDASYREYLDRSHDLTGRAPEIDNGVDSSAPATSRE